jgi:hypothetical protein
LKSEIRNPKFETGNPKSESFDLWIRSADLASGGPTVDGEKRVRKYDLEERTLQFAVRVRRFIKQIPKTVANHDDSKQLIRASGSVGANYIEANESCSEKDFL